MALVHCGECVSVAVQALGKRWDVAHVIVYLPFHFQMALSRKNVLLDTLSLSLPLSFLTPSLPPPSLLWLTPVYGLVFRSRTRSMRSGGR